MKINNPKLNKQTDYTVVIECTLQISAELGNSVLERFLLTGHSQTAIADKKKFTSRSHHIVASEKNKFLAFKFINSIFHFKNHIWQCYS